MKRVAAQLVTLEHGPEFLPCAGAVALTTFPAFALTRAITSEAWFVYVLQVRSDRLAPSAEQVGLDRIERLVPNHVWATVRDVNHASEPGKEAAPHNGLEHSTSFCLCSASASFSK